jgi:hypothetical protein
LIPLLVSKAKGITLYAFAADKALLASQFKAQRARAGYISSSGPLILHGMETIDVTAVREDMFALNHNASGDLQRFSSNSPLITTLTILRTVGDILRH